MFRIPPCLDSRLTDGGEVVSLTRRPSLYSPETLFLCLWYSFLLEAEKSPKSSAAGRIRQIIKNHSSYRVANLVGAVHLQFHGPHIFGV
jgi:hypothetical protein